MPSILRHPLRIAVLVLALGSGGAALAQAGPSRPARPTPEQMQKIFPEQKRLSIRDQQARMAILREGERCMAAAGSSEAVRTCMKQEREAYQNQRRQHWDAMKALMEKNGIPVPQWGKGDRRGKWGKGSQGAPGSI
jgi:hypothetical protein